MTQHIDVHAVTQQIHVTGLDTSRGGLSGGFDGEHVLTGDPEYPPEELAVGQLLYDGVEVNDGTSGIFFIVDDVDLEDTFDRAELGRVTVNELMSAMLEKVKEQSDQISELKSDIQELKGL